MSPDDPADGQRVNAFRVGESYLFKHYFEGETLFSVLKRYYNGNQYRFEVPADRFYGVQAVCRRYAYDLAPVEDNDPYAVLVRKYTAHPDDIFKQSVLQRDAGDFNCFLLRDEAAVERAVADGAVRLTATDVAIEW